MFDWIGMMKPIYFFSKNDAWYELSNFSPHGFEDQGSYWPTVEHYYQAQKFLGSGNAAYRERIRLAPTAKQAKELGQARTHPLRKDWEAVKEQVMRFALRKKFQKPELRCLLLSTGRAPLCENSPFDHYWGLGKHGAGRNRLGILLMELRASFAAKEENCTWP